MPQQPQMMMMPQPMMTMQPTQLTSATGANAAELIEEQLHPPAVTETATSYSMLDVAPEVKPSESSAASSESGSSEGKRVIKLSWKSENLRFSEPFPWGVAPLFWIFMF